MLVIRGRKGLGVFKGGCVRVVVLGLLVDTSGRRADVGKVTLYLSAGVVVSCKVVVRFEELLILDNAGGVAIDRGVFVRADVPDGGCRAIRGGCGGDRGRRKADGDISSHG